jgi:glutamate/tyrosine decarboxylase-like PLP-dependent enzyme
MGTSGDGQVTALEGDRDPLAVSPAEMREMARAAVDLVVDLLADPRAHPALRRATPAEMRERIDAPPPAGPRPFGEVLDQLGRDVLPFKSRTDHPGYFAFIPSNGTFPGALGDFIASALNVIADSWLEAPAPSQMELTVLDWFKDWLGYPDAADGVLLSGGSAANLTALACARETLAGGMRDDLVLYASDQGHSSVARAARTLGFRPDQLRVLPTDAEFRMRPDTVDGAIRADLAAGRTPLAVCAAAGSTNTGAIDPLAELADTCERRGAWLHVDAAYGGFAVLTERGRRWLRGIERADSITLDPHKWLYQPFECGCVLVRDGRRLRRAFQIKPDYLLDTGSGEDEVNFADRGLQLTRMWRALKIWLSFQTLGADAFAAAIDRSLDLAGVAEGRIRESEELELLRPARLGIVCFRRRFGGERTEAELEALNRRLISALGASGVGFVSSTRLRGTFAVRLVALNHTTTAADVAEVLDWLAAAPAPEAAPVEPAGGARDRDQPPRVAADRSETLGAGWADGRDVTPEALRAISLFAALDEDSLSLLAATASTIAAKRGENITIRWGSGRSLYVILSGRVRVELDGRLVREQGEGEFFGELAALDWGAGYGYSRTASVIAASTVTLLAVPPDTLNRLARSSPALDRALREAVREHLPRS